MFIYISKITSNNMSFATFLKKVVLLYYVSLMIIFSLIIYFLIYHNIKTHNQLIGKLSSGRVKK